MIEIPYLHTMLTITCLRILIRVVFWIREKRIVLRRELQLLLVYICIVVVTRFTFFPFSRVDGVVQSLLLETDKIYLFRINYIPFVNLMDYPDRREAIINFVGNTAMFIPFGIVWPSVFRKLDSLRKVIAACVACSLVIELLQLPFHVRFSDADDLILNSVGFMAGYGIYLLVKMIHRYVDRK